MTRGNFLAVLGGFLLLANVAILRADIVTFADPGVQASVRLMLKIPQGQPVTSDAMLGLNAVSLFGVSSLQGLQYATNLQSLSLETSTPLDLSPLSGLSQISDLDMRNSGSALLNLQPLSGLTSLQNASFTGPISNLAGLGSLKCLTNLSFAWNGFNDSDLLAVSMLNSLQYLQIDGGSIQDIRPVSNITRLYLSNTTWTNLAQLSGFIKLKSLILQNPAITDLSSLPALPNLNQIMLDGPIKDLSPLHRLPQLSSLGLDCTGISDLSQISSFSNLQELSLGDNGIVDISPLSSLKCLTFLSLSANSISDLDALRGLNNLDVLDLCDNHVSNIEPISQDHISGLLGLLSNPLDANAYNLYIPLLMQNNPTLSIAYDPTPEISTKYLFAIPTLFTAFLNRRFWKTTLAFWGHHIHLHRPEATRPEMSTVPPELFEDFHFANLILCG